MTCQAFTESVLFQKGSRHFCAFNGMTDCGIFCLSPPSDIMKQTGADQYVGIHVFFVRGDVQSGMEYAPDVLRAMSDIQWVHALKHVVFNKLKRFAGHELASFAVWIYFYAGAELPFERHVVFLRRG